MKGPVKHRSAGIVVVRRDGDTWKFLLLRAWRNWGFPKGLIEPGEAPLAAARRETREETGLTDLEFRWGQDSVDTEMYGDRKIARYFLAATDRVEIELPINPELGHPEHHEYRWVTADEARRLLPPYLHPVLRWVADRLAGASAAGA